MGPDRGAGYRVPLAGGREVSAGPAVTYAILENRSQDAVRQMLDGYYGIVLARRRGAHATLRHQGNVGPYAHKTSVDWIVTL